MSVAAGCAVVIKDFLSLREVTDKRSGVCRCAESAGGTSRSGGGNVGLDLVDSRAKSLGDLILLNGQVAWAFIHSHDVFTRPREAIEAGLRDRQRLVADALVESGRNSHRWRNVSTGCVDWSNDGAERLADRYHVCARIASNGRDEASEFPAHHVERGVSIGDKVSQRVVVSRSAHMSSGLF